MKKSDGIKESRHKAHAAFLQGGFWAVSNVNNCKVGTECRNQESRPNVCQVVHCSFSLGRTGCSCLTSAAVTSLWNCSGKPMPFLTLQRSSDLSSVSFEKNKENKKTPTFSSHSLNHYNTEMKKKSFCNILHQE